jgi:hypothetical protein
MAAVANQVHSTAQQIGARIGWNPIDAATDPPTGTRERALIFLIHGLIIATWASRKLARLVTGKSASRQEIKH